MSARRRHRLVVVLVALGSLLFMQLAMAAYNCPAKEAPSSAMAAMAQAGLPCSGDMAMTMDEDQPGLCHAHCQAAQQSTEKAQPATPVGAVSSGFAYLIEPVRIAAPSHPAPAPGLGRPAVVPIAVRHCCFRI